LSLMGARHDAPSSSTLRHSVRRWRLGRKRGVLQSRRKTSGQRPCLARAHLLPTNLSHGRKNPSGTCGVTGEALVSSRERLPSEDAAALRPQPRAMARAVALRGRMTSIGYEPENCDWLDLLTEIKNGRRIGRNPLTIEPDVLRAAGHGPRRTRGIVAALGVEPVDQTIIRHKDLRRHCLVCAESKVQVRCWAIIDCPLWPYRLGRNPHNPQRGRNPFVERQTVPASRKPVDQNQQELNHRSMSND
jgi:hypothetical protein